MNFLTVKLEICKDPQVRSIVACTVGNIEHRARIKAISTCGRDMLIEIDLMTRDSNSLYCPDLFDSIDVLVSKMPDAEDGDKLPTSAIVTLPSGVEDYFRRLIERQFRKSHAFHLILDHVLASPEMQLSFDDLIKEARSASQE